MAASIPEGTTPFELPQAFHARVAVDRANRKVYIPADLQVSPLFRQVILRAEKGANPWAFVVGNPAEIKKLQDEGHQYTSTIAGSDEIRGKYQEMAIAIIVDAAKRGANNIHIQADGMQTEFLFTVNRQNLLSQHLSQAEGIAVMRSIYQGIAGTTDAGWHEHEQQNAIITPDPSLFPESVGLESIRIVRGPCYPVQGGGQFMTLRLQYLSTDSREKAEGGQFDLEPLPFRSPPPGEHIFNKLGFSDGSIAKLMRLLSAPTGLVVFSGPTGSGKTTSLVQLLTEGARRYPGHRVVTIEDPSEYKMPFAVRQVVTNAKDEQDAGRQYMEMIRTALRMEPHDFFLGELRGPDVTWAAVQAVMSSHKVWTTTHAIDPFLTIDRIENMDQDRLHRNRICEPEIIAGLISQRLVPKLCECCSEPLDQSKWLQGEESLDALRTWGDISNVRVQGPGCKACNGYGTEKNIALVEVVITDRELMDDFKKSGTAAARRNYYKRKQKTADPSLYESGMELLLSGQIDPSAFNLIAMIMPRSDVDVVRWPEVPKDVAAAAPGASGVGNVVSLQGARPLEVVESAGA